MTSTCTHPLARFHCFDEPGFHETVNNQEAQKVKLYQFAEFFNSPEAELTSAFEEYRKRLLYTYKARGAVILDAVADTSIAIEVSRPGVYENAGLPLHPIYGFFELPDSAVKGCARSYAETVWFAEQYKAKTDSIEPMDTDELTKAVAAWRKIEQVFGWADDQRDRSRWIPKSVTNAVVAGQSGQAVNDANGPASSIGCIRFAAGIPARWTTGDTDDGSVRVQVEILNNHHRDYYDGKGYPGDWEAPNMVFFLATRPGARFEFPLMKRGPEVIDELFELAQKWLAEALVHTGIGAKTGVGYGYFNDDVRRFQFSSIQPTGSAGTGSTEGVNLKDLDIRKLDDESVCDPSDEEFFKLIRDLLPGIKVRRHGRDIVLSMTLSLTTPAFLAAAGQTIEKLKKGQLNLDDDTLVKLLERECNLVGKPFKSRLRWWWRTMHAGFLPPDELRLYESLLFGSTDAGRRLAVKISPVAGRCSVRRFDERDEAVEWVLKRRNGKTWYQWDAPRHAIIKADNDYKIEPITSGNKTVQGLFYAAYGMDGASKPFGKSANLRDEQNPPDRTPYKETQRFMANAGSEWKIRIRIPAASPQPPDHGITISQRDHVLQVVHSLRLLQTFGGMGARSGKGFGSVDIGQLRLESSHDIRMLVESARGAGKSFREGLNLGDKTFSCDIAGSASLEMLAAEPQLLLCRNLTGEAMDAMCGIDLLGAELQRFASHSSRKHRRFKAGLGLPRKTKFGATGFDLQSEYALDADGKLRHQNDPEAKRPLRSKEIKRFASPVHFSGKPHVAGFQFAMITFETPSVPYGGADSPPVSSKQLLSQLAKELAVVLPFPEPSSEDVWRARRDEIINNRVVFDAVLIPDPRYPKNKRSYAKAIIAGKERAAVVRPNPGDGYHPPVVIPVLEANQNQPRQGIKVTVISWTQDDQFEFQVAPGEEAYEIQ
ncbi:MAG: type III-B CRISPR module RAMP protein Cmr6 [Planctomyces sp.]|nr:type III-B CRISPR module RAMP protein Cmr6 [Planctomyces sp.]